MVETPTSSRHGKSPAFQKADNELYSLGFQRENSIVAVAALPPRRTSSSLRLGTPALEITPAQEKETDPQTFLKTDEGQRSLSLLKKFLSISKAENAKLEEENFVTGTINWALDRMIEQPKKDKLNKREPKKIRFQQISVVLKKAHKLFPSVSQLAMLSRVAEAADGKGVYQHNQCPFCTQSIKLTNTERRTLGAAVYHELCPERYVSNPIRKRYGFTPQSAITKTFAGSIRL
jgi:hypothetical protein